MTYLRENQNSEWKYIYIYIERERERESFLRTEDKTGETDKLNFFQSSQNPIESVNLSFEFL